MMKNKLAGVFLFTILYLTAVFTVRADSDYPHSDAIDAGLSPLVIGGIIVGVIILVGVAISMIIKISAKRKGKS